MVSGYLGRFQASVKVVNTVRLTGGSDNSHINLTETIVFGDKTC